MLRKFVTGALCAVAVLSSQSGAFAQQTDSKTQTFSVVVPSTLSITAPASVSLNHDQTDANQVFPVQQWVAACNNALGANITFSTTTCFRNVVGTTTYKRNVRLALAIATSDAGSGWGVTVANDVTNYAATTPDEAAAVSANSTAPGAATFNLTATFLDTDFSALAAGTYSTVVTGLITAN